MREISRYIKHHEQTIVPLYKDYNLKYWDLSLAGSEEGERALVAAKQRYLGVYNNRQEFHQLQQWKAASRSLPPDETRQFKLIYDAFVPNQIEEDVLKEIVEKETHIENLFNTFRADFEGGKASDNQLRDVLKKDPDLVRRKAAWQASKQIGEAVAPALLNLIRVRNREARKLGYPDYYSMMFELQELDERWVFSLFDSLEKLSAPAFAEMKTELDSVLKKRYGATETASYPWLYSDPFFQEYPTAGGGEALDEIFKESDIETLTRRHFASIGLDINDLLKSASLYEREGKSQHAFCLDVDREGDVRVLCNIQKNERWMSTMLHEFGHAVYDKFSDHSIPFLLRTPAHILTTEAIAMLNGRMSKSPEWLVKIAGLSQSDAQQVSAQAWNVLRSEMLIFLRWAITFVRFERELYRDPEQNLNQLWWEYVERYQRITPPPNRNSADWASKYHLSNSPAYYQNYVLGELMASQVLRFIHRDVVKSESFVGHPQVGNFFIDKIFRPGTRYPWNEMLKRATGENLNPEHFIQQFV
jgi:peptidyl-dipeptidase A